MFTVRHLQAVASSVGKHRTRYAQKTDKAQEALTRAPRRATLIGAGVRRGGVPIRPSAPASRCRAPRFFA
jgi:hypothetical protein